MAGDSTKFLLCHKISEDSLNQSAVMLIAVVREDRLGLDADCRLAVVPNSCCQCHDSGTF